MNRLKLLREEKGLNQNDIATLLNISVPAYSYYENEKRDIPTEVLVTLSNYYGVSVDYILGASNSRNGELNSNLLKIGLDMKNYTPPTEEQKKQIEDFAKFVLKDNKKE